MARTKSIGAQIDDVFKLREKLAAEKKKYDLGKQKLENMKDQLIETLTKQGLESGRGASASVSIKTAIHAQPEDWDAFYPWMYKNKMGHLMFKRLSDTAYREILELRGGEEIPGVKSYTKETLSILRRTQ